MGPGEGGAWNKDLMDVRNVTLTHEPFVTLSQRSVESPLRRRTRYCTCDCHRFHLNLIAQLGFFLYVYMFRLQMCSTARTFTQCRLNIQNWDIRCTKNWREVVQHQMFGYCIVYVILIIQLCYGGHAVAQLVEALRYKPKGRGFDSRWSHWNFSVT
jgi:hypothetical protein